MRSFWIKSSALLLDKPKMAAIEEEEDAEALEWLEMRMGRLFLTNSSDESSSESRLLLVDCCVDVEDLVVLRELRIPVKILENMMF